MIVVLTAPEVRICEWVGQQRFAAACRANRDPGAGPSKDDQTPTNHIHGAQCEFAASIMLNLYWRPSVGSIDQMDIGGLVEVRSTVLEHGCLIVKPKAADTSPYMLVIKRDNQFRFGGWIMAGAAKKNPLVTKFGDPGHFVRQEQLHDFASLNEFIRRQRCAT